MQDCISDVKTWMTSNKLKLNDDKTVSAHCLEQNLFPNPHPTSIHIGDTGILFSLQAKNLGVTLTNNLSMEKHVTNICRSAYIEIRTISNIRHYLMMLQKPSSVPLFCQNVTTVILFHLVLQNIFLTNSKRSKIRQPDLSLFKTRKHEHTNPLLQKLHWLPIVSRIQYKVAPLCYNSFTESYPAAYLSELLDCLPSRSRQLRSISDTRTFCRIPFTKT